VELVIEVRLFPAALALECSGALGPPLVQGCDVLEEGRWWGGKRREVVGGGAVILIRGQQSGRSKGLVRGSECSRQGEGATRAAHLQDWHGSPLPPVAGGGSNMVLLNRQRSRRCYGCRHLGWGQHGLGSSDEGQIEVPYAARRRDLLPDGSGHLVVN